MRKGVSPIIATVILIAITVTLGFIVFNSSSEFIAQLAPTPYCERILFEAGIHENGGEYFLEVTNLGNEIIEGFNLQIKDNFENVDIQKIELKINPGQSISQEINLENIEEKELSLIPIIANAEGNALPCDYVFAKPLNSQIIGFVIG
ncbi:MAG: archaellin/type IV pilin N-terminal domain-containing protein [Nanoarchaeota archaeon]